MKKSILLTALFATILLDACDKNDDPQPVEQELITTVELNVTDGVTEKTYTYKIQNGFGSGTPGTIQIDTVKLQPSTEYAVSVNLYNESVSPKEDITTEVEEENNEHLFLWSVEPTTFGARLAFSNGNKDANGAAFNRTGTLTTSAAGNGTLRIYLLHEPTNKNAAGYEDAGGETDVDAPFPVLIQ